MAIKGITEERSITLGGRIRIGRKNERGLPEKVDHFIFDPFDDSLAGPFKEKYGEAPKELPIMLHANDRDLVFPHFYRIWKGGKKWCEGDNEYAMRRDFQTGKLSQIPCNDACPFRRLKNPPAGETVQQTKQRQCGPEGNLRFILYELPTIKVFEAIAKTTSIININTCLDTIQSLFGRLVYIPMVLSLVPIRVTVKGTATTIYVFQLDVRKSFEDIAASRKEESMMLADTTIIKSPLSEVSIEDIEDAEVEDVSEPEQPKPETVIETKQPDLEPTKTTKEPVFSSSQIDEIKGLISDMSAEDTTAWRGKVRQVRTAEQAVEFITKLKEHKQKTNA